MGVPKVDGLWGKIPPRNGWFRGTPIHFMEIPNLKWKMTGGSPQKRPWFHLHASPWKVGRRCRRLPQWTHRLHSLDSLDSDSLVTCFDIWCFPEESWRYPQSSSIFDWDFPWKIHHPAMGYPWYWKPPYEILMYLAESSVSHCELRWWPWERAKITPMWLSATGKGRQGPHMKCNVPIMCLALSVLCCVSASFETVHVVEFTLIFQASGLDVHCHTLPHGKA